MLPPFRSSEAATQYTITAQKSTAPITNGETAATAIWGYNGEVPGPVLRVTQGEQLNVRLVNELEQPTSVHWHGIRIVNNMDGSPLVQDPVAPGESFDYQFIAPDAGTYWYHTHTRGFEQMTRGLYGMLIVDEKIPTDDAFDDELLLVFDDWRLGDDGQIEEESIGAMMHRSHAGRMGNWGSVNGRNKPTIEALAGSRLRARLVNVCNARILNITFGELASWIIALDGQPTAKVSSLSTPLELAPGQRADLVIDIPKEPDATFLVGVKVRDTVYEAAYLKVKPGDSTRAARPAPVPLPANPLHASELNLDKPQPVKLHMLGGAMGSMSEARLGGKMVDIRSLVQQGKAWAFNGISDMDKSPDPLFSVTRGTTVTVDMFNDTRWPHAMHVHGHHFKVISKEGVKVDPGPWRDTHLMQPAERHTIALLADNPGDWLMHCHMVDHAASGMTGWFQVT